MHNALTLLKLQFNLAKGRLEIWESPLLLFKKLTTRDMYIYVVCKLMCANGVKLGFQNKISSSIYM